MTKQNNEKDIVSKPFAGIFVGTSLIIFIDIFILVSFWLLLNHASLLPLVSENVLVKVEGHFYLYLLFLLQFLYVIPLFILFRRRGKRYIAIGIWIGTVISGLINALYYVYWLLDNHCWICF